MRKYAGAFVYDKQVMGMGRRIILYHTIVRII